jgi:uncharacterized protein
MKKKLFSMILILVLAVSMAVSVSAADGFVYDDADLLPASQESSLSRKLAQLSDTYDAQIVVATVPTVSGGYVDEYLEYFYDSMGFGYGPQHDGVLLLVCMDPREYRILSNGYAGVAIDPGDISDIGDMIVSDLSDGDYSNAFHGFANQCAYYLDGYLNGFPFDFGNSLMISLFIGLAVGAIVTIILCAQLKTVRKQNRAHEYVKSGSMRVTVRNDIYLYRNVSRTRKESSSSSRGGRSSRGGSSRSTGGGSF